MITTILLCSEKIKVTVEQTALYIALIEFTIEAVVFSALLGYLTRSF